MTTTSPAPPVAASRRSTSGLWLALLSAAGFGTSGVFAKSLLEAGWSPGGAVTVRIGGAALLLLVPAAWSLRGRWHALRRHAGLIVAYGLVAVAACQFAYFNAVTHLSVGVALLIEYLAPVLLVAWLWVRTRTAPSRLTLTGSALSVAGLVLVLDVTGDTLIDPVGVLWALGAAVSVVVYFLLSARDPHDLPPIALAGSGMVVAAVALVVAGVTGLMPLDASTGDVTFLDRRVHWLVPVAGMVVLATAIAYALGIAAARRLGSRLAAFVGLTEVLCAVLFAWLVLDELPLPIQLAGGALILVGIGCIRYDELAGARTPQPT